ncbi:MAG: Dabb family protein [Lachnospiraceae bacterium]
MVKHVILWKLKETATAEEKETVLRGIKENLEALVGTVPGLLRLEVVIHPLMSSNADVMLDSVLESEAALKGYQSHPAHVAAANTYVRPFTEVRLCMDYEVQE